MALLTSSIYKYMKRASTHLFKRQSKNRTFSNFYFDLRPPGGRHLWQTPGQDSGARTRPKAKLECVNPRRSSWGGGWSASN